MSNNSKPIRVFVPKMMVYPLKIIFYGIAFYFFLDVYEIFSTGTAHGRYGKVFSYRNELSGYLSVLFLKTVFTVFFLALAYRVREKPDGDSK